SDPGWSHASFSDHVQNSGGRFGAWLADLSLFLMGASAWWIVVLLLHRVYSSYLRLASQLLKTEEAATAHERVRWEQGLGFALLMFGSMGMEALRLRSLGADLPNGSGGMIGTALAQFCASSFGLTGATLLLLVAFAL